MLALFMLPFNVVAQEASAEFVSDMKPTRLSSGEQSVDGIKNLFYSNKYLYITNIWAGLQILDVSDVKNPIEVGSYTLEERSHNCYVNNSLAFLSSELSGVIVLDLGNLKEIKQAAKIKTKGDAQFVIANDQYAYVAEEKEGIRIYDLADMNNIVEVGHFDTPGWAWGLYLEGNTLYVADKSGGLIILDVTVPTAPKRVGQFNDMRYAKSVQVEENFAYVSNGPDGLWIFDISNKAFPKLVSKTNTGGYIYHASKAGNTVFLANETKKRVDIISVVNPNKPVKEGEYVTEGKVFATWKDDVYVYIAADTKTIIVRHNHPPIITPLTAMTVAENAPLAFTAQATDQDGDSIYYEIENLPEGATFDQTTGAFNWVPTYDQSGLYPKLKITVFEKTESKLSTQTVFDINVNHVNRAPALPDVADAAVNENANISFIVEAGSDPDIEDKGKLTYRAEHMPEGAVFDSKTRSFSWVPAFTQSGIYTIDFIIEDPEGLLTRDAATITVAHVDRKPILEEVADLSGDENDLLSFTLNGADLDKEDQDKLSFKAENLPEGAVFNAPEGTFSWTPTYDQSGTYKNLLFIFTAGEMSDSTAIDINVAHVNRAPEMTLIAAQTTNENDTLSFTVSGTDPDVEDEGKLTFSASNLPQGATFDATTQTFRWVPGFDQSGSYNDVTFTINDPQGLNNSTQAAVTVNHVNRTPLLADVEAKTVAENALLSFELVGSDPDTEDAGKLSYVANGLPQGAVLQGQTINWTPTYDQSGSYDISFVLSDGQIEVTKQTTVTVNHVNRAPAIAEIAPQTVAENSALQFKVEASDPDTEDAGKFTLSTKQLPEGAVFDAATATFSWTPNFEQSGSYDIQFINTDPQNLTSDKTVKVEVSHVNRTPVFAAQPAQSGDENQPLSFNLIAATDPDKEDLEKLVYTAENLPEGATFDETTRAFNWTPSFDQSGTYTAQFKVSDGAFTLEQPVTFTINHVNRAPEITANAQNEVAENSVLKISLNPSDPDTEDAGKFTTSVTGLPTGAQFDNSTNTINWTPNFEQSGDYSGIVATVTDAAGLTAQTELAIKVTHVNRAPEMQAVAAQSVKEDSELNFSLSATDADSEDAGKLTYALASAPNGMQINGTNVSWKPGFDQAGSHTATVVVSDGALEAKTDINITVEDVNRSPEISGPATASVEEGATLSLNYSGSDPDNQSLSYRVEGANGVSINSSGALSFTPNESQVGSVSVTVIVSDGSLESSMGLTIEVSKKPEPQKQEETVQN